MRCGDCHATELGSLTGGLAPVTFEAHCRECHRRELEFDVYQALGRPAPAPHTRDAAAIHQFILDTYQNALAADPSLLRRPIGRDLAPATSREAWLAKVAKDSEDFLFDRKCAYCHEHEGTRNPYPVVKKVNRVAGRYVESSAQGEPWLVRGEFSHRAHRAVACGSCHSAAHASRKTEDVLIPKMQSCISCHGTSGTNLDRCAQCHLYHNKRKELDRDRRPIEQLIGSRPPHSGD
jgi:hypothetical protein